MSEDAAQRHARHHLAAVPPVQLDAFRPTSDPLAELVEALRSRALGGDVSAAREYRLGLAAMADARHATLPARPLEAEPEWQELRSRMLVALEPFPAARQAIADALAES